jgi:hypothetical protein
MDIEKSRRALNSEIAIFMAEKLGMNPTEKDFKSVFREIFDLNSYSGFFALLGSKVKDGDIQTETLKKRIKNHIQIETMAG